MLPQAPVCLIDARSYVIPTDAPEADGTIEWDHTTIVVVEATAGGLTGLGYTYASAAAVRVMAEVLAPVVAGMDAMAVGGAWTAMRRAVRNLGRDGLCAAAISAVDAALWDLKAKLLDVPLARLLGIRRNEVAIYGSGGFTSYDDAQLQAQLGGWASEGLRDVKMKVGARPEDDDRRVGLARAAIGRETGLFVDANGALTPRQALAFAERCVKHRVSWFEEPVSSDDLAGLAAVRARIPTTIEVAAGEYGYDPAYFDRMLSAGAVDVLQADATRCCGITGFLAASALCDARNTPLSAHTAPALHLHACCAVSRLRHIEWFHDHVRIEAMLFDGAPRPDGGRIRPDLSRPGLGLSLRRADAERYAT